MAKLTREARKVLKAIYDTYLDRRKAHQSKTSAVHFTSIDCTQFKGFPDAKKELKNAGFIKLNVLGEFDLQDEAIIFMENFTKDSILKWLEFGSNFIP